MAPAAVRSDKEILQAKLVLGEAEEAMKGKKGSKQSAVKPEGKENQEMGKIKVEGKPKRRPAAVAWANLKNHDLSWSLLNIIKESDVYLVAYSFDKGQGSNNSGNGKNGKIHSQDIARKLFFDPIKPDSRFASFTENDIPHLRVVIRNRINQLKEKHAMCQKGAGEELIV